MNKNLMKKRISKLLGIQLKLIEIMEITEIDVETGIPGITQKRLDYVSFVVRTDEGVFDWILDSSGFTLINQNLLKNNKED